jgi:hypothetical protein
MPCAEDLHLWHKLPARVDEQLLLLVENTKEPGRKWLVTGYLDAETKQFISALPTKRPVESENVKVSRWAFLKILPPAKRKIR